MLQHFDYGRKLTPFELLEELKTKLEQHPDFEQSFEKVNCIYQNELSTLVPQSIFEEKYLADYLKFNAKILKSDFISYDEVDAGDSINVYVPLININNHIFDTYGSFVYKHASTILIDTLLKLPFEESKQILYININSNHFEMIVSAERRLIFYNTFEYSSKEDFIYYVLFTIEQLGLDPEKIDTRLIGKIDESDDLFEIIYTYVRHVDILENNTLYHFDSSISESDKKQHFIVLNSFEA